jgi:hypothetical protein
MPESLKRCYRLWKGGGEPAAVFSGNNTVIERGMLPKSLGHRYGSDNFKDFLGCLTFQWADQECGSPTIRKGYTSNVRISSLLTRGLLHTGFWTSVFSVFL